MTYEIKDGEKTPLSTRDRHLLADPEGLYPVGKLGTWERAVLDTEMERENALAWYRNPPAVSKDAIQIPWHDGQRWRSMQPDFVFFSTKADGTVAASIVDPHGSHLGDAIGKLRGLADFAEEFAEKFLRIEALTQNDKGDLGSDTKGGTLMLDMTDPGTRDVVRSSPSAADAYRAAGQKYLIGLPR
jgi:hypothetical protein